MPLDTRIALGVQPIQIADPMAQYSQFAQARAAGNQNALAQYQLGSAQRADVQANALNEAYAGATDPNTGEIDYGKVRNVLAQKGAGAQIPALEKTRMEMKTQQLQQQDLTNKVGASGLDLKVKTANKAISDIASLNTPKEAIDSINVHVANGDIAPDKAEQLKNALSTAPTFSAWQKRMLINILDAKDKLVQTAPKPTEMRLGDTVKTIDMNPSSPTFQQEVVPPQTIGMTANERAMLPIHKAQLKVAQDRLNAEMATGNLTPATVDFIAETYRQTGTLPPLGMGPMAAAARSKILTRAGELAMSGGATAAEAAGEVKGNKAELAGATAGQRTIGTQIANVQVAANETNKMIGVAKPYVDKVMPTDYPALNAAGNFVAKNTGDPNIVGLATSLNAIVNTYARAINPKGVATVSDKNHAREILNAAMSKGQLNEAFNVMQQEMGAALASGPETKAAMRPSTTAAPAGGKVVDFGSLK